MSRKTESKRIFRIIVTPEEEVTPEQRQAELEVMRMIVEAVREKIEREAKNEVALKQSGQSQAGSEQVKEASGEH